MWVYMVMMKKDADREELSKLIAILKEDFGMNCVSVQLAHKGYSIAVTEH